MTFVDYLLLLSIAALCASLAMVLAGPSRGGCLVSVAIGFAGAALGVWIATATALPPILVADLGGGNFPIFWAILGSALLVSGLRMTSGVRAVS